MWPVRGRVAATSPNAAATPPSGAVDRTASAAASPTAASTTEGGVPDVTDRAGLGAAVPPALLLRQERTVGRSAAACAGETAAAAASSHPCSPAGATAPKPKTKLRPSTDSSTADTWSGGWACTSTIGRGSRGFRRAAARRGGGAEGAGEAAERRRAVGGKLGALGALGLKYLGSNIGTFFTDSYRRLNVGERTDCC